MGYLLPVEPVPFDDEFVDLIGDLVAGVTGLDRNQYVRPRWQPSPPKQPPPTVDWVAFGVQQQIPDDNPVLRIDNADETQLRRSESVVIALSFYGPRRAGYAGRFREGVHIDRNRWTLRANGIAVTGVGPAVNAAEEVANKWEPRVDITAEFVREVGRKYEIRSFVAASGLIVTETLSVPFSVEGEENA
ncbi:MAG TPA: hypothetical protein VNT52_00935 [Acidimicrobiales bacterium]|nr:hypothetical protein [Acidimicrobiales bacterium]